MKWKIIQFSSQSYRCFKTISNSLATQAQRKHHVWLSRRRWNVLSLIECRFAQNCCPDMNIMWTFLLTISSQETSHGWIIIILKVKYRVWSKEIKDHLHRRNSNSPPQQEKSGWRCFGTVVACAYIIPREGYLHHLMSIHRDTKEASCTISPCSFVKWFYPPPR